MRPEGKKSFSMTRPVPEEFGNLHLKEIDSIFQKVCAETLKSAHRARVTAHNTLKGDRYTFLVSFGSHQPNPEGLTAVLDSLIKASLWLVMSKTLQQKASMVISSAVVKYNETCLTIPKQHISVKPKQHIKLC